MDNDSASRTSPTLLARLGQEPADQQAWREFVDRYGRRIFAWCRGWHLQDADASDVTQMVLLKLAEKMSTFQYDPAGSFRAWLKTLTQHAWMDFVQGRQKAVPGQGGSDTGHVLQAVAARDDLVRQLEEEFDRELLEEAMRRVRDRVQPSSWEAFRLTAVEGLTGAAAAAQLGMRVAAVFKAKNRVQKLLREEIQRLEGG